MRLVCVTLLLITVHFSSFAQNWSVTNPQGANVDVDVVFQLEGLPALDISGCQSGNLLEDANCILSLEGISEDHTLFLRSTEESDNHFNGVTTLDLVMTMRHIIALQPFGDLVNTIAADVNGDHKVSALDVVLFRSLVLGIISELPIDSKYKLLKSSVLSAQGTNPDLSSFYAQWKSSDYPLSELNIIVVSVGDVNNTTDW